MAEKEPNRYREALESARDLIDEKRTALAGDGGLGHAIRTKIAGHEGWVCDAADDWVADFTGKCTPVMTEFDTAYDEVNSAFNAETELEVPEGHWKGLAYGRPYAGGAGRNIPI